MRLASADVAAPFVVDVLARDGSAWVRASTDSMTPLLRAGDRLRLVSVDPTRIRPGDLVAYRRGAHLIVHRVLLADAAGLVTKGDALPGRDAPVGWEAVVGRVVALTDTGHRAHDLTGVGWRLVGRATARLSRLAEVVAAGGAPPTGWRRVGWMLARLPVHVLARAVR
jgi:signal peptidase I